MLTHTPKNMLNYQYESLFKAQITFGKVKKEMKVKKTNAIHS